MNYWPRWIGDWRKKTLALPLNEKGAYGELLDHAYVTEQPLPAEKEDLYRICGARGAAECNAVDKVLARFFVLSETGYEQPRVREELAKRHDYIESQRGNAMRRWDKERAAPIQRINGAGKLQGFTEFYSAYPRHTGRAQAERAWIKLAPDADLQKTILAAIERQKPQWSEPQFIPHPSSWLNGKRWTDEIAQKEDAGQAAMRAVMQREAADAGK